MKSLLASIVALTLLSPGPALASGEAPRKPYISAQRSLAVNRSLLSKAETEYERLSKEEAAKPSAETSGDLSKLRYKIKALREDAERLQSELPKSTRAAEFLKDLLQRKPADTDREEKLDKKLEAVYALHEKALAFVAQKRYGEAAKIYEGIILESPDDDEAYLLLGHTRLISAEFEKAKQAFLNAIHIDPANRDEIPRFYQNILVENPQDDAAYSHLGFTYWMLDQKEDAKEAFESALEINPDNLEARTALDRIRSIQ